MNAKSPDQPNDLIEKLPIVDIVKFIQEFWKTIAGFTTLGIAGGVLFIVLAPKQFEVSAQIKMAQIASLSNNSNVNPLGIDIEEPQALIARMALPTTYDSGTIKSCGLADEKYANSLLAKRVKISIPKGVSGTVNLKILGAPKDNLKACVDAIFQLIKFSQAQFVHPYIEEAQKKLVIQEGRLSRATQLIARADDSGAAVSAAYLATRDEIRYLVDQISSLQDMIASSETRAARLIAPIYVKDEPIFPGKPESLFIGLLLGGFIGLGLALARKWYQLNRLAFKR